VTRSNAAALLVLVVAALFVVAAVAGTGGGEPNSPLEEKVEGATTARDGRGVSPDTNAVGVIPLLGTVLAILGTLGGVWWGQVLEDKRRRRGDVTFQVSASWLDGSPGHDSESRWFEVRFFNDRDVNVALWDVQVEYYQGGEFIDTLIPYLAAEPEAEAEPIDLESRRSVYRSLVLTAEGAELTRLKNADEIKFVATMKPTGEKLSKSLPTWDPL
jgi:hypothetical protein